MIWGVKNPIFGSTPKFTTHPLRRVLLANFVLQLCQFGSYIFQGVLRLPFFQGWSNPEAKKTRWTWIPFRKLTYPTKREKENHLQKCLGRGYVHNDNSHSKPFQISNNFWISLISHNFHFFPLNCVCVCRGVRSSTFLWHGFSLLGWCPPERTSLFQSLFGNEPCPAPTEESYRNIKIIEATFDGQKPSIGWTSWGLVQRNTAKSVPAEQLIFCLAAECMSNSNRICFNCLDPSPQ